MNKKDNFSTQVNRVFRERRELQTRLGSHKADKQRRESELTTWQKQKSRFQRR